MTERTEFEQKLAAMKPRVPIDRQLAHVKRWLEGRQHRIFGIAEVDPEDGWVAVVDRFDTRAPVIAVVRTLLDALIRDEIGADVETTIAEWTRRHFIANPNRVMKIGGAEHNCCAFHIGAFLGSNT